MEKKGLRRIQILSAMILVAGLGMAKPAAANSRIHARFANCAYCSDACIGDLAGFCHDHGCSSAGATCGYSQCQGVDEGWYDYDIECGAAS
jgi:hypothetical protein